MDLVRAAYLYALSRLKGIGPRYAFVIARSFSDPESLIAASSSDLRARLGWRVASAIGPVLPSQWQPLWRTAHDVMLRHEELGVCPVPITSDSYPWLLKLIPDPPIILYVKGTLSTVQNSDAVAVVGTREPTEGGRVVANRVARGFASSGYVVVSGLARGIDTEAHKGALDARGLTVAVMPTSLDSVYPAENKPLAERILANGGALVSELPLGTRTHHANFAKRDRIQSGLSLAVIPVQTDMRDGTRHTVGFAREHNRPIFCPTPSYQEAALEQYSGILDLIRMGKAVEFQADSYQSLLTTISEHKTRLYPHT